MQSDNNHVPFIKHFVALSFLIILLNSCFDPDEEHFVEVQRVDDPGLLKIDIEPADDPVMYVSGEKITFNVTPMKLMQNLKIYALD